MSNLLKSKFLLGVLVVAVMFVGVAFIGAEQAAAQQPVVSASDIQYAATVKVGSSGQASLIWQKFFNHYSSANLVADGAFGPLTSAAAKIWQASRGLVADGVMGPMSRASAVAQIGTGVTNPVGGSFPAGCSSASGYSATTGLACSSGSSLPVGCTSTAGYSPTTGAKCDGGSTGTPSTSGPLEGTDGTISSITQLSQYSSEEVGDGSNDVKVLGFEVEASKDGDIGLKSFKLYFDSTGNGGTESDRLTDYLESVDVYMEGTKVGSADSADFTKESTGRYSKVITLDSSAVVRSDDTVKLYVAVNAVSNLDSGDIVADSWTVGLANVRYVDGSGVVTTEVTAIPAAIVWNSAGDGVSLLFVSFSTASDINLKLSTNTTPDVQVVKVDDVSDTAGVVLLKGKMKLEGTSDAWLDELPVTFTSTGASNPEALASTVTLTIDGQEFTKTMTTGGTPVVVVFDNLDLTIVAGDTVNFSVAVDVNDTNDSGAPTTDFDEGDSLTASVTAANRAAMVVEDEQADALTDGTEITGTVTGNAQTFYSNGIAVTVNSKTATITDDGDVATFVSTAEFAWNITVSNIGDSDVYINKDAVDIVTSDTGTDVDTLYTIEYSAGAVLASQGGTIVCSNCVTADSVAGDNTAYGTNYNTENFFKLTSGTSRTFTITVNGTNQTNAKQVRAFLAGIEWTTDLVTDPTASDGLTQSIFNYTTNLENDSATTYKLIQ